MKRYLLILCLLFFALSTPAYAHTVTGGDAAHRGAVESVLANKPELLAFVETVWPNFTVRICRGGHAWEGSIDVDGALKGQAFTYLVAHEFAHEVQLAADEAGLGLGARWIAELNRRGYTEFVWSTRTPPWYGKLNPWEALAENIVRAYWSPYYTGRTTPNTCLAWLSRAEVTALLREVGVLR